MSILATVPFSSYHNRSVSVPLKGERTSQHLSLEEESSDAVLASASFLPLSL
jgi:hypothetical protein